MTDHQVGTIRRFPIAIRLDTMPRHEGGKLFRASKITMMDSLVRTLYDIGWNQQAESCVNPMIKFRVEPKRVLCDLLARQEDVTKAAVWRNNTFNGAEFRHSIIRGLAQAVEAWESGQYEDVFVVTPKGVRVVEAQASSDLGPGKL